MALFGSKKNTAKKITPRAGTAAAKVASGNGGLADVMKTISQGSKKASNLPVVVGLKQVIRRPRITEKAANMTVQNVYTFDITQGASKHDVVRAVKALYKVTPIRVNVVNTKGKKVALRTRRGWGQKNNNRKAYVYLKAGDKIDFAS